MPRITHIGVGLPKKYSQEEVFHALGYRHHFWSLFHGTGLSTKPLCLSPAELVKTTAQDTHENYKRFSLELSQISILNCLMKAKLEPCDIDKLIYVSCTGGDVPATSYWLVNKLGFRRDTRHEPVMFTGCQGALPGMEAAYNHVKANPEAKVLMITCEISNAAYFPDDKRDPNMAMANAIFGDGSATALIIDRGTGLEILDFYSIVDNDYIDDIKLPWIQARLKVVLSGRIPSIASAMAKEVIEVLLKKNNLKQEDIAHFVIHSGGSRILDKVEEIMGLPRKSLKYSWETWGEVGNLSSATIMIALMKLIESGEPKDGDKVLCIGLGAGLQCMGMLAEWRK